MWYKPIKALTGITHSQAHGFNQTGGIHQKGLGVKHEPLNTSLFPGGHPFTAPDLTSLLAAKLMGPVWSSS